MLNSKNYLLLFPSSPFSILIRCCLFKGECFLYGVHLLKGLGVRARTPPPPPHTHTQTHTAYTRAHTQLHTFRQMLSRPRIYSPSFKIWLWRVMSLSIQNSDTRLASSARFVSKGWESVCVWDQRVTNRAATAFGRTTLQSDLVVFGQWYPSVYRSY